MKDLRDFATWADARLRDHFERWRDELPRVACTPSPEALYDQVVDLTMRGGKRLRPALVYHTALCFEHGLDPETLLDASLSVELLQASLLIHDDIMDRDEVRRGGPTVHHALAEQAGDDWTGVSLGMLAGSLAGLLAQRLLLETNLHPQRYIAASAELLRMNYEVLFGQQLDIVKGAPPGDIHRWKTSSYTTLGPMRLGGALGGAREPQVAILAAYGEPLGRAFQMRDDLLGVFGKAGITGKPVGADLRAGKRTDLVERTLTVAPAEERATLEAVLGDPEASDEAVAAACALIERVGVRAEVEREIEDLTNDAIAALETDQLRPAGVPFLVDVASWLARREH